MNREIIVIAHNLRSSHNVGSIFRTCEGLGVKKLYLTGYTPFPIEKNDPRLPHIANKVHKQIQKTALSAEKFLDWAQENDIEKVIKKLKTEKYSILALEQSPTSKSIDRCEPLSKIALIIGNEVEGIDAQALNMCDEIIEIPMLGKKESFNVVQATAMTLYAFRYMG